VVNWACRRACPVTKAAVLEMVMTLKSAPALAMFPALALAALAVVGCSSGEKPKPRQVQVPVKEVPALLRGTIGAEVEFRGIEPVLVSGYGLVVGLNGTGGDVLPDSIAATMEREMGLNEIGKANELGNDAITGKSPREVLRDKNVAVVLVQAAIPPGAPANATFDVYVQALNASSLEGGTLWTTDLRLGQANAFGGVQARRIAVAKGPIFINPFEKQEEGAPSPARVSGRILAGGRVANPLAIEMVLMNPSFARARAMVSAINSRFPAGPGDPVATARGRSGPDDRTGAGGSIALHVPNRFRQTPGEFLSLIRHLQIEQGFPEQYARRYVEGMKNEPVLADEMAWCLEAIGVKSLPFVRELYDFPETRVQLAALRTGARLEDPLAAPHLKELALKREGPVQLQAIALLGQINATGPTVDEALKDLLAQPELSVRVAAYEALAGRAERTQLRRLQAMQRANPDSAEARISPTQLQLIASRNLSGRTIQGIEREFVADKFFLDIVPVGEPLIYISQQGQPRVVLFGENNEMRRPAVVSAWGDRLMLTAEETTDKVRVYYKPANGARPIISTVSGRLPKLIEYMAHKPTPEDPRPGLNFTYSEVVGALQLIQQAGGTRAAFATEIDQLKARIQGAKSASEIAQRPESPEDRELVVIQPKGADVVAAPDPTRPAPKIVPITPATDDEVEKARKKEGERFRT